MNPEECMETVPFEMDVELQFLQGVVDQPAALAVRLLELTSEDCFYTPQYLVLRRHIKTQLDLLVAQGENTAQLNFVLLLESLQKTQEYPDGFPIADALLEIVSPRQGTRPSGFQCYQLAKILNDLKSRRTIRDVALHLLETAATGGRERLNDASTLIPPFLSRQKARQERK